MFIAFNVPSYLIYLIYLIHIELTNMIFLYSYHHNPIYSEL